MSRRFYYNNYEADIVLQDDYSTRVTELGEGRMNVGPKQNEDNVSRWEE